MQTKPKDFWKLFRPSACSLKLGGNSQEEIFDELLEILVKAKVLSADLADPAKRALTDREQLASTGVGQNVAIPHVKLKGLEQAVFGLSVHQRGVDWHALDGEPVTIFFTVLRPEKPGPYHDPDRHRELMGWIASLAREPDFRRFAMHVSNRTELVDLVKEMSARIG